MKVEYLFLSKAWQPDWMANEGFKNQGDEKLKVIDHARDVLKRG
ncbi:MAG TPA: hypothetical protein PKD05_00015 [Candidatus Melainabacteria bacterium]|nr:hypothetical protein [Candidatus Melainabacteria bacterium]HMP49918.1 hypothetical protein [Candidatus Melainabacteria bacterium]